MTEKAQMNLKVFFLLFFCIGAVASYGYYGHHYGRRFRRYGLRYRIPRRIRCWLTGRGCWRRRYFRYRRCFKPTATQLTTTISTTSVPSSTTSVSSSTKSVSSTTPTQPPLVSSTTTLSTARPTTIASSATPLVTTASTTIATTASTTPATTVASAATQPEPTPTLPTEGDIEVVDDDVRMRENELDVLRQIVDRMEREDAAMRENKESDDVTRDDTFATELEDAVKVNA